MAQLSIVFDKVRSVLFNVLTMFVLYLKISYPIVLPVDIVWQSYHSVGRVLYDSRIVSNRVTDGCHV